MRECCRTVKRIIRKPSVGANTYDLSMWAVEARRPGKQAHKTILLHRESEVSLSLIIHPTSKTKPKKKKTENN